MFHTKRIATDLFISYFIYEITTHIVIYINETINVNYLLFKYLYLRKIKFFNIKNKNIILIIRRNLT